MLRKCVGAVLLFGPLVALIWISSIQGGRPWWAFPALMAAIAVNVGVMSIGAIIFMGDPNDR